MKKKINTRMIGIAVLAIIITMVGITSIFYGLFTDQVKRDLSVSAKLLKDTHYFDGRMVQAHYQLLNTLGMNKESMKEFLKDTIDYINLLKTKNKFISN